VLQAFLGFYERDRGLTFNPTDPDLIRITFRHSNFQMKVGSNVGGYDPLTAVGCTRHVLLRAVGSV
jgi:hypothetical protein